MDLSTWCMHHKKHLALELFMRQYTFNAWVKIVLKIVLSVISIDLQQLREGGNIYNLLLFLL